MKAGDPFLYFRFAVNFLGPPVQPEMFFLGGGDQPVADGVATKSFGKINFQGGLPSRSGLEWTQENRTSEVLLKTAAGAEFDFSQFGLFDPVQVMDAESLDPTGVFGSQAQALVPLVFAADFFTTGCAGFNRHGAFRRGPREPVCPLRKISSANLSGNAGSEGLYTFPAWGGVHPVLRGETGGP